MFRNLGKSLDLTYRRGLLNLPVGFARGQWSVNRVIRDRPHGQGWLILTHNEIIYVPLRLAGAFKPSALEGVHVALAPVEGLASAGLGGVLDIGARFYDRAVGADVRIALEDVEAIDEQELPGKAWGRVQIRATDGAINSFTVLASGYRAPRQEHARALSDCLAALRAAAFPPQPPDTGSE